MLDRLTGSAPASQGEFQGRSPGGGAQCTNHVRPAARARAPRRTHARAAHPRTALVACRRGVLRPGAPSPRRHENTILLDKLSKILTREKTAQAGGSTLPEVAAPPTAGGGLHDIYRRKQREKIDAENAVRPRRSRAPSSAPLGLPFFSPPAAGPLPPGPGPLLQALLRRLQYMKPSIDMLRFEQQWQQQAQHALLGRSQASQCGRTEAAAEPTATRPPPGPSARHGAALAANGSVRNAGARSAEPGAFGQRGSAAALPSLRRCPTR